MGGWQRLVRSLAIVLSVLVAGFAAAAVNSDWLLAYKDKSTNDVIWDKRTRGLINAVVPASLTNAVLDGLGGPPDPVLIDEDRFVTISACVAHYCLDKAFVWIDVKDNAGVAATLSGATLLTKSRDVVSNYSHASLTVGSKAYSNEQIPANAVMALRAWLTEHDIDVVSVRFVGKDNSQIEMDPSRFARNVRFVPDSGSPSFDCKKASGRIEEAVCGDKVVSALDLDLSRYYSLVRSGLSTMNARRQLAEFQRNWLKKRNRACETAEALEKCLVDQYTSQRIALGNCIPQN